MNKYIYYELKRNKYLDFDIDIQYDIKISKKAKNIHQLLWKLVSFGRFKVYYIVHKKDIVASAEVMPWIFIFSFMKKKQTIHIGPCWTKETYRNQGLYKNLLKKISNDYISYDKYIFCSENNIVSKIGIEKVGFSKYAKGFKNRLGIYKIGEKI